MCYQLFKSIVKQKILHIISIHDIFCETYKLFRDLSLNYSQNDLSSEI